MHVERLTSRFAIVRYSVWGVAPSVPDPSNGALFRAIQERGSLPESVDLPNRDPTDETRLIHGTGTKHWPRVSNEVEPRR